ncbi:MAG: glycine rich domain-containing protein, partial [Bacteroidales bacterium]|nr:glycine rich domain-containing protein [Bacteroidales bacterium]
AGNLTGSTPPFVPPGGFFIFNHATHTVSASSATPRGSYTANTTVYMTRQTNYLQGELITCTSTKSYNYPLANRVLLSSTGATSKPAESNTVFYDIGLAAASSTLSSPWLYVQGNVKDAQLVISAGNGYPAATYSGTGQDNKWIQLNPCSITTNIASARLYVTYEPSACPSVEPVKFYSIANPPQTSGTWSPIDLSPSIPLTDAGFNALSANAALTDYWNAIPLNLEITNPSARIDGAITPLSQTQVNPSVLRLGATVYGNNTIQVGYQFPVELQINAIGGQTGVQYAKAEAIIPRGMEFVANSAYIEYDGIVYPITAGAMYAELLSLTGGTTAQHITLDLIDSGLPIFSKGEIAPNKTVYIRFVLNPACEVNSYYAEQISMTISGKRICGLDANNSNSHIYRSSSLFLTGVIASYAVNANLTIASNLDFASCHGSEGVRTVTFSAWRIDKATSVNMSPIDSIFVLMPAALNIDVSGEVSYAYSGYVAGSGTLSPSSMTNVLVNDGAMRKLAFKLDDTYLNSLGANVTSTTVTYSFTTQFEKALADDPVPDGTISASWMNLSQLSLECPETLAPAITKILPMQVYARPRVDNMENKTLCAEILFSGATFTGNYTGISSSYSYNWSSTGDAIGGTTSGSTVTSIPGFTTANIGAAPLTRTYTVTPTYGNCTGYDSTFTITVLPVPRSNTYTNQTYISGATTTPFAGSGTLTNITWTNSNTAIGLGLSGTGTIGTFTASNTTSVPISGTITVTPIYSFNATSCSGSPVTFTITVFPENYPQVILPCASLAVCEGMPLDLSACTPTVDVGSCTLTGSGSWTLNGSYYASPSTVSIGQNGAALAYIINTSCGSFTSNTVTVIVQELPTAADVTPSPTTYQICEGGSATLTATATAGHFVQWYSDSGLQNLIGWGNSYTVTPTTSTTYWVVAGTMGTKDFSYNGTTGDDGSPQSWTAPITGRYKLEVWGAQGGHSNDITYKGGRGGYAVGEVNLTAGDNLYVYVGGQPTASTHHWCSSGGGGGTDIRVNGNTYYHRIIVAGGGGGRHGDGLLAYYDSSCDVYAGNDGGGLSAPSFSCHGTDFIGAGQTAGGSSNYSDHVSNGEFGYGPDNTGNNIASTGGWNGGGAGADEWASGGAGGGWYGGGTSWPIGGGGSGWIYTASAFGVWQSGDPVNAALWQLSPTCYLEDAQTIAGDQPFTWPDGTVQTGHSGHGYARITFMEAECPAPPLAAHTVTVTVLPIVTPAATITASDNNVCMGTSVTYTVSNTVNQGTAPSYQWLKGGSPIGGAIGTTYSYEPENGDIISCEMTSNDPCAGTTTVTSNAITMTMTPIVIPSVSVSAVPD